MADEHDSPNDDVLGDVFASDRDRVGTDAPAAEGRPRDEMGRFAPSQPVPDQTAEAEPPASEQQEDPGANRHVPLSEMLAERKKFQDRLAEAERYKQEADQLRQFVAQFQQANAVQQPPPDIFEDPDRFLESRLTPYQQQMENMRLDMSEDRAREKHGDAVVDEAFQAAQAAGILANFVRTRHPYGELVQWHQKTKVLQEVGSDPQAYRQRLEQEIRQQVMEELKSGRAPGGNPPPRFPTSLADQTNAGGNQGAQLSTEAVMNQLFNPDRSARG